MELGMLTGSSLRPHPGAGGAPQARVPAAPPPTCLGWGKALQVMAQTPHQKDSTFLIHICRRAASFRTEMRAAWGEAELGTRVAGPH